MNQQTSLGGHIVCFVWKGAILARRTLDVHRHFAWQAQHFRRLALRVFLRIVLPGLHRWQRANCVAWDMVRRVLFCGKAEAAGGEIMWNPPKFTAGTTWKKVTGEQTKPWWSGRPLFAINPSPFHIKKKRPFRLLHVHSSLDVDMMDNYHL